MEHPPWMIPEFEHPAGKNLSLAVQSSEIDLMPAVVRNNLEGKERVSCRFQQQRIGRIRSIELSLHIEDCGGEKLQETVIVKKT